MVNVFQVCLAKMMDDEKVVAEVAEPIFDRPEEMVEAFVWLRDQQGTPSVS